MSSGTQAFNPALSDLIGTAYGRIQIRRQELVQQHIVDARLESNLLLNEFAVQNGVDLWKVDLVSTDLVQGTSAYSVDPTTIAILDMYRQTTDTNGVTTDIILYPISRSEYAALPQKQTQGPPTSFWWNRQITSVINLWPTPDDGGPYVLKYYRIKQIDDANVPNGTTLDLPYRFLDAFTAGLAARLARIYAPPLLMEAKQEAMRTWQIASQQDVEYVPMFISPGLGGYYRN